jgi:hypothetical protein
VNILLLPFDVLTDPLTLIPPIVKFRYYVGYTGSECMLPTGNGGATFVPGPLDHQFSRGVTIVKYYCPEQIVQVFPVVWLERSRDSGIKKYDGVLLLTWIGFPRSCPDQDISGGWQN